ncbi:MAG: hypothetical protein LBE36_03495 [Flavobacteriaceae bacterium]|jgi:hypothetical protein|nr:hypothetical protein [Flavobacteriaceae bacterium]
MMQIRFLLISLLLLLSLSCKNKTDIDRVKASMNSPIVSQSFYNNGNESEIIYEIDSLDTVKKERYTMVIYSFYENGKIKEIENEGIFNGFHVPMGTRYKYSSDGKLIQKIYYNNDDFGKDFILFEYYDNNEKLIKTEKYNNYILYETEPKLIKN